MNEFQLVEKLAILIKKIFVEAFLFKFDYEKQVDVTINGKFLNESGTVVVN